MKIALKLLAGTVTGAGVPSALARPRMRPAKISKIAVVREDAGEPLLGRHAAGASRRRPRRSGRPSPFRKHGTDEILD